MPNVVIAVLVLLLAPLMHAHVVSISTGELRITGRKGSYELHMPAYEIENVAQPESALLNEITFEGGRKLTSDCSRNGDDYVCKATYEFDRELPDRLDVDCTLFRVTAPNHVHMLYAVQGSNSDQVVFDQATTHREIRFHSPTLTEAVVRDGSAGAMQLLRSVSGLLFLVAIGLAARGKLEASILAILFLASEWLVRPIALLIPVSFSLHLSESLMALTVAYLAAETVFLPNGSARWLVVPLFGLVHGLPFASLPAFYLGGATTVQFILLAGLVVAISNLPIEWRRPLAGAVFVAACGWFARLLLA